MDPVVSAGVEEGAGSEGVDVCTAVSDSEVGVGFEEGSFEGSGVGVGLGSTDGEDSEVGEGDGAGDSVGVAPAELVVLEV